MRVWLCNHFENITTRRSTTLVPKIFALVWHISIRRRCRDGPTQHADSQTHTLVVLAVPCCIASLVVLVAPLHGIAQLRAAICLAPEPGHIFMLAALGRRPHGERCHTGRQPPRRRAAQAPEDAHGPGRWCGSVCGADSQRTDGRVPPGNRRMRTSHRGRPAAAGHVTFRLGSAMRDEWRQPLLDRMPSSVKLPPRVRAAELFKCRTL